MTALLLSLGILNSCGIVPSASDNNVSPIAVTYGTMTDTRETPAKTYKTTQIGAQLWMAENLNFATATGSWCADYYCTINGRYYNWPTAMALPASCLTTQCASMVLPKHQGICPVGWHVPNNADWDLLAAYIRNDQKVVSGNEGRYLKDASGSDFIWLDKSTNAGNPYGFAALSAGYWSQDQLMGDDAFFWSANEDVSYYASTRELMGMVSKLEATIEDKDQGYSLRCLKDE